MPPVKYFLQPGPPPNNDIKLWIHQNPHDRIISPNPRQLTAKGLTHEPFWRTHHAHTITIVLEEVFLFHKLLKRWSH
jgi:hypothetical protein